MKITKNLRIADVSAEFRKEHLQNINLLGLSKGIRTVVSICPFGEATTTSISIHSSSARNVTGCVT
jgi:hypothetical protein